jgi:uncharacterized membrane protein
MGVYRRLLGILVRYEVWIVAALAASYLILYGVLSVLRHTTYHSFGSDLGIFDQVFWNTTQGRPFESTISLSLPLPHSYFGDHFAIIYWLLFPFYYLVPRPETLLVIQTVFLGLGAIPLYLLARDRLPAGYPRLVWVLAYYLFLPVAYVNLFDFHETALSVVPLGLTLYFLMRGNIGWFLLSLLSTFLVKEEMPLIGMAFGVFIILGLRRLKLGLGVLAGSLAAFFAIVNLIMPALAGGSSGPYFRARLAYRYGELGGSPGEILIRSLTDPIRVFRLLAQPKKIKFLIALFGPVLGLTAFSGFAAVLVLPTLAYLLISNYEPQFSFTSHYVAPLIPLVLGTSLIGLSRFRADIQSWLAGGVLLSSLVFSVFFGDLPFSRHFDYSLFREEPRYTAFIPSLSLIPADASVASENNLTPHLTHRRHIYVIEFEGIQDAEYLALDYAATNRSLADFERQLREFEARGYQQIAGGLGLALMKR